MLDKKYIFTRDVWVEGVEYKAGVEIAASAIPLGCLESCLGMGHLVEAPPQVAQEAAPVIAEAKPVEVAAVETPVEVMADAPPVESKKSEPKKFGKR